jgi:mono/diheme cytochrome c family protein
MTPRHSIDVIKSALWIPGIWLGLAACVLLATGCGSAHLVKPKAIGFEPTIVGCSLPTECTSANRIMLRESREARKHRCPADKPYVLMKAEGALLCVAALPAPGPPAIGLSVPSAVGAHGPSAVAQFNEGRRVVAQSGCEACHKIGDDGNNGPGPELTHVADRLPRQAIARTLVNPTAPMPSFKNLPPAKFTAVVYFLSQLR